MCKCGKPFRAPFCGGPGCEWPEFTLPEIDIAKDKADFIRERIEAVVAPLAPPSPQPKTEEYFFVGIGAKLIQGKGEGNLHVTLSHPLSIVDAEREAATLALLVGRRLSIDLPADALERLTRRETVTGEITIE